ncbi:MAG: alpha/beta hydrolase [Methylobacter tundripaludum]|nr:alpha/beta hydrolase [Methylobacter tundripaludum]
MISLLLTYLLLLLAVFLFQRKMIYFPDTYSIAEQQQLADQANLKLWPSAENYLGLISQRPGATGKGTVIVFHGNAGSATDRTYYPDALERLGYRVILAEYPGYAARSGAPSEQALLSDGIQTAKQALDDFGGPIFLWGESLGGSVASGIVQSGQVPVKGIVLVTPFSRMADVAQHHYWFFLAKWLIRDKFDNIKNLQDYAGNTAIVLAEQDEIIPNKYSLKLFESLRHRKQLWAFKATGHNTLPLNQERPWWREVMQFVSGQNGVSP